MGDHYLLANMTWPEVQKALETVKLAIIPIGSLEQHGPNLAESCDAVLAEKISLKITDRLFPYALLCPTIPFGMSSHHMGFPGTISLRAKTLFNLIRDIVESLRHHGLTNFLIVNGHGGNGALLGVVSSELSHELNVKVTYAKATGSAKESTRNHIHSALYGHSCEKEVSEALYVAPEIVRTDALAGGDIIDGKWKLLKPNGSPIQGFYYFHERTRNGAIGNAPAGSYEAGRDIIEESVNNLCNAAIEIFDLNN